jgi:hypothetical protein
MLDWGGEEIRSPNVQKVALVVLLDFRGKPVETLEKTVTRGGAGGLDVLRHRLVRAGLYKKEQKGLSYPGALPQAVEAKLVCDLGNTHGVL